MYMHDYKQEDTIKISFHYALQLKEIENECIYTYICSSIRISHSKHDFLPTDLIRYIFKANVQEGAQSKMN